ncbi:hypothetical protein Tco_0135824, partial [Tanacetum coccineum]
MKVVVRVAAWLWWQRLWWYGDEGGHEGAAVAGGEEEVEAHGGGDRIDPGRIYLFIILGLAEKTRRKSFPAVARWWRLAGEDDWRWWWLPEYLREKK